MMTLAEWEVNVAPHLHGIQAGAEICERHARRLVYQPSFETLAYDDLEKLERLLSVALEKVRTAKRTFRELPRSD